MFISPNQHSTEENERREVRITITENGPYLVYGRPPLAVQFIMPDKNNESWYFQEGRHFSTESEPTALCRCGRSHNRPFCDGAHMQADWEPQLTAPLSSQGEKVRIIRGATVEMRDVVPLCVFARFCHPAGNAWHLTLHSDDPEKRRLAIREASMCPSGRLTARDKASGKDFEFSFEPSLGLIEDDAVGASGGLWVRGGISIAQASGVRYEKQNRVVLCRCGQSANKPYCDGTHVAVKWRDEIESLPEGETLPEKPY